MSRVVDGLSFTAAVAAVAAVLAFGGRFSVTLDALTHLAPLYLGVGLTVGVLALAVRRRAPLALSVIAVLASGTLMAPEFVHTPEPAVSALAPKLKLIQFNAWRENARTELVADWLAAERPDLVLMEEVSPALRDAILRRTGWNVIGRRTSVMIFSPHALTGVGVRPSAPSNPAPTWVNARLYGPWGEVPVLAAHYTWPTRDLDGDQEALMAQVTRAIGTERLLFGGDFNSAPWSFTRRRDDRNLGMVRVTRALFTWPTALRPAALLPIDHVYAGRAWLASSVRRGPYLGSDHFPVVVEFSPTR